MNVILTALEHMHLPRFFTIPFAVIYRYIPTVKNETIQVYASFKMRKTTRMSFVKACSPLRYVEMIIIPLLMRSGTIANELSASSLCKGLNVDRKRTSCVEVKFEKVDLFFSIVFLAIAVSLVVLDGNWSR